MTQLRVWAPAASRVEVVSDGGRRATSPSGGGWFRLDGPPLPAGTDYAFSVDGGEPRPDPRSPWQPGGVHAPSRTVDHAAFPWTDDRWEGFDLATAVLYELHVGTFTPAGTFDAAIDRLDHLVDLGVSAIELMPVASFPGRWGWGYDGVALFAPFAPYGGPDGLKRLVDACHARGLGVVLDVVYNHLGPDGNHLAEFGPYFTDRYATPWGAAVNLDGAGSDEVRRFFVDNALGWLRDHHLDGLRLDAVHALLDGSATHLLEQLAVEVDALEQQLGRRLHLIAESDLNDPRVVTDRAVGGYGIDAQWSDDFHHALHAALTGERDGYYGDFGRLDQVAKALREVFVYDGVYSPYRDRHHGRRVGDLPRDRFLGYLQNHDQIGNRARGDRSSHLLDPAMLQVGAALVLTAPFVPLLFQGEEWGATTPFAYFTDHEDPDLAEAVRRGRREEFATFGWRPEDVADPQDEATMRRSQLDWTEPTREPHASLLDWHRALIDLRKRTPDLTDPRGDRLRAVADDEDRWLVVERGDVTVVANLADRTQAVPVAAGRPRDVLLASGAGAVDLTAMPPCSVVILGRMR